jgi:phosphoglycerate dehydrogenase-like enzyme
MARRALRAREVFMLRVAFAGIFAASLVDAVRRRLAVSCDLVVDQGTGVAPWLAGTDVLVTLRFTAEMGAAARRLRLVQVPGASLDAIDQAALPAGTWLANAYGHEVGIAEYVMGAVLALGRGLGRLDAKLRQGEWESQWSAAAPAPPPWPELAGKTLGILGYGRIGQALARRARAFDMAVCAVRREPGRSADDDTVVGGPERVDEVVRRADVLALTLPLTPATRGLMDERRLRAMKPTAVLVNVARAAIADERALYRVLAERAIGGAVLDVWYRYPESSEPTVPAHEPFHELPNVLLTPHVSGWTEGMLEARAALIAENVGRAARGEPPVNLVARPPAPA